MKVWQTTRMWSQWWSKRKINWREHYLVLWNHPHRQVINHILQSFNWLSLMEIGCGGGANLVQIVKNNPGKQIGGIDINPDGVQVCREVLQGAYLKVGSADNIPMSDNASDVILTDMTLIYFGSRRIHKVIEEIKRVARNKVVLCELHSRSFLDRLKLRLQGYFVHDYKKLLEKHGFHDIEFVKLRPEHWPESKLQQNYCFIIKASVPKRK